MPVEVQPLESKIGSIVLVTRGIDANGKDGSSRYRHLLMEALHDRGVPYSEAGDLHNRWAQRANIGSWSLTGRPRMPDEGSHDAVIHVLESVSVPGRGDKRPIVVTVHDLCAVFRPELVSWKVRELKRLSWRRRHTWDLVIVPSIATRDDVAAAGVPEQKIVVIRHPVSSAFANHRNAVADEGKSRFVLMVGPPTAKKGADLLIDAMQRVDVPGALLWVTRDPASVMAIPGAARLVANKRVFLGSASSDEQLAILYSSANAVIVPSRWEGFSFPIAEAAALGVGTIASDIAAHREFDSTGLLTLVRPEDELGFADAISDALRRPMRGRPVIAQTRESFLTAHLDAYARVAA
jgi:glycosyltransferase involved in cell wall biosynthesis